MYNSDPDKTFGHSHQYLQTGGSGLLNAPGVKPQPSSEILDLLETLEAASFEHVKAYLGGSGGFMSIELMVLQV